MVAALSDESPKADVAAHALETADAVERRLKALADAQPEPDDPWIGWPPELARRAARAELAIPPGASPEDGWGSVTYVEHAEGWVPWDEPFDPAQHVAFVESVAAFYLRRISPPLPRFYLPRRGRSQRLRRSVRRRPRRNGSRGSPGRSTDDPSPSEPADRTAVRARAQAL